MPPIYLASDAYLGWSVQAERGTAVAPTNFVRWSEEVSMEVEPDVEYIPRGGDGRDVSTSILKLWSANAEFMYDLEPIMGAKLLTLGLGKAPIAGTDVGSGGGSTLDGAVAAGVSVIDVADATGYAAGNLIQIEADYHEKSEIHEIESVDTNEITLVTPLMFAHDTGVACNEVQAPFTHRCLPALYQPWFTLERGLGLGMTNPLIERFIDCKVSEFTITGEAGGLVRLSMTVLGTKATGNETGATATYPVEVGLFRIPGSTFTKESSPISTCRKWEIKLSQGLIDDIQTDQIYRHDVVEGMRELEASATFLIEDRDLFRKMKYTSGSSYNDLITSLFAGDWVWTTQITASNSITITIPNILYAAASLPLNAETVPAEVEVEARGLKLLSSNLLQIDVKNSDYVREA